MGRTVLHIAVLSNEPEELSRLLAYPDVKELILAVDFESGWNILHYIYYYKRIQCLNVLMEYFNSRPVANTLFMDMLKTKDRSRHAPLSLLNNDIKDFAWVPSYVNEKNEFHLVSRFHIKKDEEADGAGANRTRADDLDEPDGAGGPLEANGPVEAAATAATVLSSASTPASASPYRSIPHDWWCEERGASDIYVFGVNVNNNLGVGDSTDRSVPSQLSHFDFKDIDDFASSSEMLHTPRYKAIRVSKYHSAVLTQSGKLYNCGVGSRGRLGHGNSSNLFRFKRVAFFDDKESISQIEISNNHNLLLTADNSLYAWGHNNVYQLGFTLPATHSFKKTDAISYENTPKQVLSGDLRKNQSSFSGIGVSKIHSLAYTSNSVFFWGLNIGQMGIEQSEKAIDHTINGTVYKGNFIKNPKEVTFRDKIKLVATCETCTCIITEANDIYVYFGGQRVKLPKLPTRIDTDSQFDSFKPSKLTRPAVIKKVVMKSHNHVHLLLESGNVMSFLLGSTDLKALRNTRYVFLWLAHDVDMYAVDIDNCYDGSAIVCTRNGSVFAKCNQSSLLQRKNATNSSTLPTFKSSTKNKFRKVEGINRILRVCCDDSFSSFAVLRDEVDMLPFKLQKNDFLLDMVYLSPLTDPDAFRKQKQLLELDHNEQCYTTTFMYLKQNQREESSSFHPMRNHIIGDNSLQESSTSDCLLNVLNSRHTSGHTPPETKTMYQTISPKISESLMRILCSNDLSVTFSAESDWPTRKFCDASIRILGFKDVILGFHLRILRARSLLFNQVFVAKDDDLYFIENGVRGRFDQSQRILLLETVLDVRAVLIWLHYVYTNQTLDVWNFEPGVSLGAATLRQIKNDFSSLVSLFKMDVFHCKDLNFFEQMEQLIYVEESPSDTQIVFSGGQKSCSPALLVARTAFFETRLSGRWQLDRLDASESCELDMVHLDNIQNVHLIVILKHIHGCNDLRIFDEAMIVSRELKDPEDFVLFLLELIEIADELLLVQLKYLCELAIAEFLTIKNVLVLLNHAEYYNAQKLFNSCCWYIYNNLNILLFDPSWQKLETPIIERVEIQMQFLDSCKDPDLASINNNDFEVRHQESTKVKGAVSQFLEDINTFNEIYMSDRKGFSSFEVLVDLKPEMLPAKEPRKKLNVRRLSRKGSFDTMIKSISISQSLRNDLLNEHVIADDEDYGVFGGRKRKEKIREKLPEQLSELASESSQLSVKDDSVTWTIDNSTEITVSSANLLMAPYFASGEGSSSNASSSSLASISPALGESIESSKRPSKIKFNSSSKLSQKQRKKLAEAKQKENKDAGLSKDILGREASRSPWSLNPQATSSRASGPSNLTNLPILGQTPPIHVPVRPKEEVKWVDKAREVPVKKTLQEIQQEEEFARWWEKESKRVQMEMSSPSSWLGNSAGNGIRNGSFSGNSRNGPSRGKRGGRSASTH